MNVWILRCIDSWREPIVGSLIILVNLHYRREMVPFFFFFWVYTVSNYTWGNNHPKLLSHLLCCSLPIWYQTVGNELCNVTTTYNCLLVNLEGENIEANVLNNHQVFVNFVAIATTPFHHWSPRMSHICGCMVSELWPLKSEDFPIQISNYYHWRNHYMQWKKF